MNNNDSVNNVNNETHYATNSKNLTISPNEAKNSPTTKRKADESAIFDSDDNLVNTNDKTKKLSNIDITKN